GLALSDERLEAVPNGALALDGDKTLFLNFDPQFYVGCPERLPAGTKLAVSYTYYPLQTGADDTVFHAMRRGIELVQARAAAAAAAADEQRALAQNYGEQLAGQERRALHLEEQLEAAITEKEHFRISYEAVLSSACWKLTAPIRALFGRKQKAEVRHVFHSQSIPALPAVHPALPGRPAHLAGGLCAGALCQPGRQPGAAAPPQMPADPVPGRPAPGGGRGGGGRRGRRAPQHHPLLFCSRFAERGGPCLLRRGVW